MPPAVGPEKKSDALLFNMRRIVHPSVPGEQKSTPSPGEKPPGLRSKPAHSFQYALDDDSSLI